jgi:hypothetical protein
MSIPKLSPEMKEQLVKIAKGAMISGLGALLVAFAEGLKVADFGAYTPVAVAVASILVNTAKVLLKI